jgi:toxin-antitoxin system PIN domain toxin
MSTSLFPDVNVWLALAHAVHPHHGMAVRWLQTIDPATPVFFSRFTQLGLLRLLTTRSAMDVDVMTQAAAWGVFDHFLKNPSIQVLDEPGDLELLFRQHTHRQEISPKQWADGYLTAFAEGHGLVLVTFDKALSGRIEGSILLHAA